MNAREMMASDKKDIPANTTSTISFIKKDVASMSGSGDIVYFGGTGGGASALEVESISGYSSYKAKDPPSVKGITKIVTKDAEEIRKLRVIIVIVLLITVSGALLVYFHTKQSEENTFNDDFYDDAKKVLQSIGQSIDRTLSALESFSTEITTIATLTNQTFPFVRIPQFAIHAAKFLPHTDATILYYTPIVPYELRREWVHYSAKNNTELPIFVNETLLYQEEWSNFQGPLPQNYTWPSTDVIFSDFGDIPYNVSRPDGVDVHLAQWHTFPLIMTVYPPANWDFLSTTNNSHQILFLKTKKAVFGRPYMVPNLQDPKSIAELQIWCDLYTDYIRPDENCMEPMTSLAYPIFDKVDRIERQGTINSSEYILKAELAVEFYWRSKFRDILPDDSNGIVLVVKNVCGNDFTYQINGRSVKYLGSGDKHDPKYDHMYVESTMDNLKSYFEQASMYSGVPVENEKSCLFSFHVYPSDEMKDQYYTNSAIIFALSAAAFIIFPFSLFLLYDWKVTRQKEILADTAERSDAIISSLFPSHVHDQLLSTMEKKTGGSGCVSLDISSSTGPIADLYPETTVLFADIANFTVWSSVRDPNQVFILLETVYGAFDQRAEKRRVFKVETVGDCYVAVCGLPDPRKGHAIAIALFAKDILLEMISVTAKLENQLGPGTSNLAIRIGMNSGPTTAGVLRGSRGRYQLFGDTVNTASRMESHSSPGRILCSRKTADLIIAGGKEHWITERSDLVGVKGKGTLQCYWCNPSASKGSIRLSDEEIPMISTSDDNGMDISNEKFVSWLVELFEEMLSSMISSRDPNNESQGHNDFLQEFTSPRDEVVETIVLPQAVKTTRSDTSESNELDPKLRSQLRSYIHGIVSMYKNNPFHNVEHAGHVIMATKKLLSRILKPKESSASSTAYGITSDPLTQFAIVFAALIHDVDHPGVSNAQLVKEDLEVARLYNNKSVAEQHAITVSWDLLSKPEFTDLRCAIMPTSSEYQRFRQLIVNSVMATDLFDGDLKSLRERRWRKAFEPTEEAVAKIEQEVDSHSNRRATIVIEHIIQASDVSHTMQHWHVYQDWNCKLFQEMYLAYVSGRSEKDPSHGWYEGELWFFDSYIIPLAKKLKTCGVFGVSCDELLDYAIDNRTEWAAKGRDIVAENIVSMKNLELSMDDRSSHRSLVGTAFDRIVQDSDEFRV